MPYMRPWTVVLAVVLIATTATSQQPPRFELSPDTVLMDEPFRVAVAGLKPGQAITIRADGPGGVRRSSATFQADASGRVDVADPMKFVWSATAQRPPAAAVAGDTQPLVFTAEADGQAIATGAIRRRAIAADVRAVAVRERGLVGVTYYPAATGRLPAVIVLSGSQGGIPGPASHAGGLASRGYVVLALAYFNAEGLAAFLQNVPLEYFATAVDWLKAQRSVDSTRIGVLGTSRGGELALLLGATYPSAFRVVVANVPSSVVWPGLSDDAETAAWTLNGKPLVSVRGKFGPADLTLPGRNRFLKRMNDTAAVARAAIPVERIGGPVLLFSGKDDQVWPSDVFAAQIVERLKAHRFKHPVEHYSYENAGHGIARPYVPTADVRQVRLHPVSKRPNMFGGTPEGQARANVDSWEKLLAFLNRYLR
jgi:dienelactone hydrolase